MPNDPINFRPNADDRRILDRIMSKLADLTGLETMNRSYTAAIRHALRQTEKIMNREEE